MKAALLTALNAPLEIVEAGLTALQFGQVQVKVLVSGICGAQLQEIRGEKVAPLPRFLGHEAAGIVEAVGVGVNTVSIGNRVVLHWRLGSGIESDFPRYIVPAQLSNYSVPAYYDTITSGKVVTFTEQAIVSENRCTAVPLDTPDELCALLGCGLSTALGVVENDARLRFGETVLILGVGGLGVNLIRACKLRQAGSITACDIHESKRQTAESMGACYVMADQIGVKCESKFDVIIDTTGNEAVFQASLPLLDGGGRYVMVGQPKPGASLVMANAKHMFDGTGKSVCATQGGGFQPDRDIPKYVAMHKAGLLNLDGIVSERLPLAEINRGLDLVRQGQASRVMIYMDK